MSEQKFEPCTLRDATHVEMGNKVHKLESNKIVLEIHADECIGIELVEKRMWIPIELFSILGIKPLKEVKPEPIEFEARFVKYDDKWHPTYRFDDGFLYPNCKIAMFKCVEILEEEE